MTKTPQTLLTEACELIEQSKTLLGAEKAPWEHGKFIVILPGGIPIRCQTPRKTFNEVITRLGVEVVYELKLRTPNRLLISNEAGPNQEHEIAPGRYIQTALSNGKKAEILLDVAEGLDVELFIIDIDKRNNLIAAWRTNSEKQMHSRSFERSTGLFLNDR